MATEAVVAHTLRKHLPGLRLVLLYGSRVYPENPGIRADSDWDIAACSVPTATPDLIAGAQLALWRMGAFNLVDPFWSASAPLLREIVGHHRVLWQARVGDHDDFLMRAMRVAQDQFEREERLRTTPARAQG